MEDFPKYLPALRSPRQQKLLKISLRDHRNLRKLTAVQADQFLHRTSHLPRLRHRLTPVRKCQHRITLLECHSGSPSLRPQIFRIPVHYINLSLIVKCQFHKGRHIILRIFTAKHPRFTHHAAGFAIQRKHNRIKDRGLACPRISRDQIQSMLSQPGKIKLRPLRVGAKRTHNQF